MSMLSPIVPLSITDFTVFTSSSPPFFPGLLLTRRVLSLLKEQPGQPLRGMSMLCCMVYSVNIQPQAPVPSAPCPLHVEFTAIDPSFFYLFSSRAASLSAQSTTEATIERCVHCVFCGAVCGVTSIFFMSGEKFSF